MGIKEELELKADDHGLVECKCGHTGFVAEANPDGTCVNCPLLGLQEKRTGMLVDLHTAATKWARCTPATFDWHFYKVEVLLIDVRLEFNAMQIALAEKSEAAAMGSQPPLAKQETLNNE